MNERREKPDLDDMNKILPEVPPCYDKRWLSGDGGSPLLARFAERL